MDLSISMSGWLNMASGLWAVAAWFAAAIAGFRALKRAASVSPTPAFPACIIVAATRWLFVRPARQVWDVSDYIALAVFALTIGCLFNAINTADFMIGLDWRKLGHVQSLQRFAADILTGSALIVLFAGISHHYAGARHDRPE